MNRNSRRRNSAPKQPEDEVFEFELQNLTDRAFYRNEKTGVVIARSSQPEVGWFGWRSNDDEKLLKKIADACATNQNPNPVRFVYTRWVFVSSKLLVLVLRLFHLPMFVYSAEITGNGCPLVYLGSSQSCSRRRRRMFGILPELHNTVYELG